MSGLSTLANLAPATDATAPQPARAGLPQHFAAALDGAARDGDKPTAAKREHADRDSHDRDRKRAEDDPAGAVPGAAGQAPAARADGPSSRDGDDARASKALAAHGAPKQATKASQGSQDEDSPAVDTSETGVDAAELAPVLDALKQASAATPAIPGPPAAPTPDVGATLASRAAAEPLPATASLLAARVPAPAAAAGAEGKPATKKAKAEAVDATLSADAAPSASGGDRQPSSFDTANGAAPDAGKQLASGSADRALDMAKQGAWLDGLARDIASAGSPSSTLRFHAAPEHLGAVQVEIARSMAGASVTLTASSETGRAALADARPQLIAEARAQGLHIASAQVDVSADPRPSGNGGHAGQRHDPRAQAGLSSQADGQGGSGANRQTRYQPFAVTPASDSQPTAPAETDEPVRSGAPAGGLYA